MARNMQTTQGAKKKLTLTGWKYSLLTASKQKMHLRTQVKETETNAARASNQRPKLMIGVMWRKLVAGLVARARHRTDWLLRPRHIPQHPIGNRRRNGHFSSFGRRMSSDSCYKPFVSSHAYSTNMCHPDNLPVILYLIRMCMCVTCCHKLFYNLNTQAF